MNVHLAPILLQRSQRGPPLHFDLFSRQRLTDVSYINASAHDPYSQALVVFLFFTPESLALATDEPVGGAVAPGGRRGLGAIGTGADGTTGLCES